MKMVKTLLSGIAAAMLVTAPVLAEDTPEKKTDPVEISAGDAANKNGTWASMPIGAYVMVGGIIFIVTAGGLVLLDDEDNPVAATTTTTPTTTTTTTTTTSTL